MTQFYSTFWAVRRTKTYLLFAFFLCAFYSSQGQVYYASLTGPNEFPTNSSPGTGKGIVTIDPIAMTMRVQATFSGLVPQTSAGLPSGTTASHIHAPTPIPLSLTSTAGVATTTPTFTGFPSGVREGSYDRVFDMTQASSYNPAYITANGGTPLTAFAALRAAITAGRSYLNIHTNAFPGGEIRGYLIPCPSINVSIADAFALAQGVLPNTVYPAYAPAASLSLQAGVTGGTAPYSYNWSNGTTNSLITVSPTTATSYSVTVTDQNGCPGTASKMVKVMDVAGGKNGQNITVCHKGQNSLTVAAPAVAAHLDHGDMLGSCNNESRSVTAREMGREQFAKEELSVRILSNPSPNYFELQVSGKGASNIQLTVYDLQGRVVETKPSLKSLQTLKLGTFYRPGIYLAQITQGNEIQTFRLIKTKQ